MPITVECSGCGKKYKVGDERAGDTISCKECGDDIDVPGGRKRRPAGKKSKRSSGGNNGVMIGAGIGVGLVIVVGVVAMFAMGRGQAVNPVPPGNAVAGTPSAPPSAVPPGAHSPTPNVTPQPGNPQQPNPMPIPGAAQNQNPPAMANANPPAGNQANTKAAGSGFKGGADSGGSGFEFKPLANWKVQPDPGPNPPKFETAKKFNVKLKGGFVTDDNVVYPVTPSPFAMVSDGDNMKASRDIWNLATGSKAGSVKGQRISGNDVALSPDGKYVAWFRFEGGGAGIEVYDIPGKKTLGTLSVDAKKFNVAALAMPTSTRLVALSDVNRGILWWKLPSGDLEREVNLGENGRPGDNYAFSPGGKYLAFQSDFLARSVQIQDLDSGEVAASIEFVKRPPNDLLAMAFSPDGQEFAMAYDGAYPAYGERIVIWKMATGAIAESIVLEEGVKKEHNLHGKGCSLQWFPNGQQLLLHGVAIVDRSAKRVVYSLGKPKLDAASLKNRRVLDNGLLAVWEGTRQESTIQPLQIKDEDISRSVAAVEAGGLMVDAKLPKLSKFDGSSAQDLSSDKVTGWQVQSGPNPLAGSAKMEKPLAVTGSGQPRDLCVAPANGGVGFVRIAEGEDANDLRNRRPEMRFRATKAHSVIGRPRFKPIHCERNWVEVYDLANGKSLRRIDVEFSCDLLAASADGKRLMVAPHDGQGRIDIYSADDGSHIAGCRPFQSEAKDENRDIESAFFLDTDHVGVTNFEDRLIVLKLPDCKALYELQDVVSPRMSPNGKLLAVARMGRVELRELATGKPVGALDLGGDVRAIAFHPDGERMAAANFEKKGTYIHEIDLKTGRAGSPIPLPTSVLSCHWCGPDHVLIDNKSLFDMKQKTVAWTYELPDPNGTHVLLPPDDRHWYLAKASRGATVQVVATQMPDPAAQAKLSGAKLEPKILVQPGGSVTVMSKIPERPDQPGFQADVVKLINKALEGSGVKEAKGQPIKLAVNVEFKAGKNVPVRFHGAGGPQEISLQEKTIEISVAYDSNGAVLWNSANTIANIGFFVRVPTIETAQKSLDDQMWERARNYFDSLQLPSYVFSKESVYGLGTSNLTGDGPQVKK